MQTLVEMMKTSYLPAFAIALLLISSGCRKENPIELVEDGLQAQGLEIENGTTTVESFNGSEKDSSGFFLTSDKRYFGRLLIAGSEFDGPLAHHEASLAQAVLFDRSQPVVFNGDTI